MTGVSCSLTVRSLLAFGVLAFVALSGCKTNRWDRSIPVTVYHETVIDQDCDVEPRPAKNIAAFTGGGMYGAYSAGILSGWTDTGTRPELDVVTGISTGALVGTCAFIGPSYDGPARQFYTTVRASDVYSYRSWAAILFSPSVASNKPLKARIDNAVNDEVIKAVANGHRKGRRLYVGTTNLETKKLVIWDMGALACQGTTETIEVFRTVLLASCAVPGMLPPVRIDVIRDGKICTEWHADGGVTAPFFVPPKHLTAANTQAAGECNLYVIVAGKYFPDPEPVKPRILRVLQASATAVIYSHCNSELVAHSNLCKLVGARYHASAVAATFKTKGDATLFDPLELTSLYEEGYRQGAGGPVWDLKPPDEVGQIRPAK